MRIKLVGTSSTYDGKGGKRRATWITLEDGTQCKRDTLETEPELKIGDIYPDEDYELIDKQDVKGNKYKSLVKKQKQFQSFQKEYDTLACLINNSISTMIIPLLKKEFPLDDYLDVIYKLVNVIDSRNTPKDNKTSQNTPSCEDIDKTLKDFGVNPEDVKEVPLITEGQRKSIMGWFTSCEIFDGTPAYLTILKTKFKVDSLNAVTKAQAMTFMEEVIKYCGAKGIVDCSKAKLEAYFLKIIEEA